MLKRWAVLLLFVLLLSGCGGSAGETLVWIDIPWSGNSFTEISHINIEGHATSPEGVAQVEVWVNGSLVDTINSPPMADNLARFQSGFTPTGPGEYIIQVIAIGNNGDVSEPDTSVITIGEESAEEDPGVAPTPTHTPVEATQPPTPIPEEDDDAPIINYWADPNTIEAGGCTIIKWDIRNVKAVEFGGQGQDFQGEYRDCMCETQVYPLRVTYNDGTQETLRVTVNVTGTCPTEPPPPPPPDTEGPSDPTVLKPIEATEFACLSYLMLRWTEVTDPSGVPEYQIQLERERNPDQNLWDPWEGGMLTGISGLEKEIYVECGHWYRFRVRGVDGEGNFGFWSDWRNFLVSIG